MVSKRKIRVLLSTQRGFRRTNLLVRNLEKYRKITLRVNRIKGFKSYIVKKVKKIPEKIIREIPRKLVAPLYRVQMAWVYRDKGENYAVAEVRIWTYTRNPERFQKQLTKLRFERIRKQLEFIDMDFANIGAAILNKNLKAMKDGLEFYKAFEKERIDFDEFLGEVEGIASILKGIDKTKAKKIGTILWELRFIPEGVYNGVF